MEIYRKKPTQRQKKNIYYDFMRFQYSTQPPEAVKAFIRAYLNTFIRPYS
jgi:hypothetical protein